MLIKFLIILVFLLQLKNVDKSSEIIIIGLHWFIHRAIILTVSFFLKNKLGFDVLNLDS